MRNIFIDALVDKAKVDENILLITADLGYGVVDKFAKIFPERFFNTGITEQSTVSMAAGLASRGFRPFVYSIANFPTFRALEQVRNDLGYMQLGVTLVALGEGFSYGTAGYSHHLVEDISAFRALDGISIFSPSCAPEIETSLDRILLQQKPALLRLGRLPENIPDKADVNSEVEGFTLWKEGSGPIVIFHGGLADEIFSSLQSELVNRFDLAAYSCFELKPQLAFQFLNKKRNKDIITVEEHVKSGGLGSIFLEVENEFNLGNKIKRIGIDSINKEFIGDHQYLRKQYGLDSNSIIEKISQFLKSGR